METNGHLDAFTFRTDGLFFDPQHHACVLMGTVEFASFWHAFDGCFSSPIGRKLIYAATDAEETMLRQREDFQYGRWFGRRRVQANLRQRSHRMGWGRFEDEHILMPANDAITVGLFLAHREHTAGQRFNLEWNQRTSERIDVVLQPKEGEMTPVPPVEPFTWLSSGLEGDVPKASLTLDLDHRGSTLFNGQARSFFLPVSVIQRLLDGLRGRPTTVQGDVGSSEVDAALEEPDLFLAVVHASFEAFRSTDQPVYLQRGEDWGGHLSQQFTERGFGRVEVLQSVLDGADSTVFRVQSPLPAVVAGSVLAMWCRAHGKRPEASFSQVDEFLTVTVREPRVNYD